MATLKAKYVLYGQNWAEVGDSVIVSATGEILTKEYVEETFDNTSFDILVDPSDDGIEIEVEDSVYKQAEQLAELYRRAVEQYRKNPPKTLEEDLDYNFGGDDDSDEWIGLYENPDPSETNPS